MSAQDAIKWNQRYQTPERAARSAPRSFLIEQAEVLPRHGLALDIAMGLGTNAAFLSARGLRVIGFDISEVAVRAAFADWRVIAQRETWLDNEGWQRAVASLVVQRP